MGNLVLCHDRRAVHPFEITRIHCRIYTIEELCYYLCNNLYLIDYTIMNEQLCGWLEEELGMDRLASELRDLLRLRGSVEKFVITILKASRIYKEQEMIRIQNVLEHLKTRRISSGRNIKATIFWKAARWKRRSWCIRPSSTRKR